MEFTVRDMLKADMFAEAKLLGGEEGLDNEILGVTIIEAPDIVKFISGGEVLLTGFYAFQSCTVEEFQEYIKELSMKKVSALAMKRGRDVDYIEEKIRILLEFAKNEAVPILEIPFELSFRDILKMVMEHLFNDEVRRLKYFKTTHDNFTALSLSFHSTENGIGKILNVLEKLIGNPVALFNQNMDCLATTDKRIEKLVLSGQAEECPPVFYSHYLYLKQKVVLPGDTAGGYEQYLVKLKVMYNMKMYLVVTTLNNPMSSMDYIAIENAVTALKQELFRQQSIGELEKKFQNDIMNNLLNGKVRSNQEILKDIHMLGIPINANYRVLVLGLRNEVPEDMEDVNDKMKYVSILHDAAVNEFRNSKIQSDVDKVTIIQRIEMGQKQEDYRKELKDTAERIQKRILRKNKKWRIRIGVGKEVEGILNISESFEEAGDSLKYIDILGENNRDGMSKIMFFSDMGIFRLLCELDKPEELMEYIPECLQKLYHYKKHQRHDLLITLNTYLDRNQNLTRTAQDLYIHYKTAAYRIERITEITGIDFDNPSEVLAVRIGLIVYKMVENLKK